MNKSRTPGRSGCCYGNLHELFKHLLLHDRVGAKKKKPHPSQTRGRHTHHHQSWGWRRVFTRNATVTSVAQHDGHPLRNSACLVNNRHQRVSQPVTRRTTRKKLSWFAAGVPDTKNGFGICATLPHQLDCGTTFRLGPATVRHGQGGLSKTGRKKPSSSRAMVSSCKSPSSAGCPQQCGGTPLLFSLSLSLHLFLLCFLLLLSLCFSHLPSSLFLSLQLLLHAPPALSFSSSRASYALSTSSRRGGSSSFSLRSRF